MNVRSSHRHWGAVVKLSHWLTLILVVVALAIILYGQSIDRTIEREIRVPLYRAMIYRHEAFGMLVLATIGLRIIWRLFDSRPAYPTTMRRWETLASSWVHVALYGLALASCILGWIRASSNGTDVVFFGWTGLPRLSGKDEHLHALTAFWHEWVSWAFVALVVFHAAAALKHHFVDRDGVLRNMLPSRD